MTDLREDIIIKKNKIKMLQTKKALYFFKLSKVIRDLRQTKEEYDKEYNELQKLTKEEKLKRINNFITCIMLIPFLGAFISLSFGYNVSIKRLIIFYAMIILSIISYGVSEKIRKILLKKHNSYITKLNDEILRRKIKIRNIHIKQEKLENKKELLLESIKKVELKLEEETNDLNKYKEPLIESLYAVLIKELHKKEEEKEVSLLRTK